MPLTPEQEWIVAVCGLIAHADGELSPGESDHVLGMLDERLTAVEHARWVHLLGDHAALTAAFAELPPPLPVFAEPLLEKAYMMVLADGHASEPELRILEQIATDIGVAKADLDEWRARWTTHAAALAEHIVAFAAVLIHHDGTIDPAEAEQFRGLVARLPLAAARKDDLIAAHLAAPPTLGHLGARLAALPRDLRLTVLRALAPLVAASSNADLGRRFFLDLARSAAIPEAQAKLLL